MANTEKKVKFRDRVNGLAVVRRAIELGFRNASAAGIKHFYFYAPWQSDLLRPQLSIHWYKYNNDMPTFYVGEQGTSSETMAMAWLEKMAQLSGPTQDPKRGA